MSAPAHMSIRLLDSDGYKWSCELFIGNKWFASLGGFDSEEDAVRRGTAIALHWNACVDALPHVEGLDFLTGPREAAAILRAAVNGEEG